MPLTPEQVRQIKKMSRDDLLAHAQSEDLGAVVEASLRLHQATKVLNGVLIALTIVLVLLTAALVYFTSKAP